MIGVTAWRPPRAVALLLCFAADGIVVTLAFGLAVALWFSGRVPDAYAARLPIAALGAAAIYVLINVAFGMYGRGWRYAGVHDGVGLAMAACASTGIFFVVDAVTAPPGHVVPLGAVPTAGMVALLGMAAGRFRSRLLNEVVAVFGRGPRQRVLIFGAGQAGQRLARELLAVPALGYQPIGFIDDDRKKVGQQIHGVPVLGRRAELGQLVDQRDADVVVLAIPSLTDDERACARAVCEETAAIVKVMPGLPDLMAGSASHHLLQPIRVEDLLGRPQVAFSRQGVVPSALRGTVLITGAAGSIGSELARQVAARGARHLVLLDVNESGLFELAGELEGAQGEDQTAVSVVVADVTRAARVREVFVRFRPSTVFHAAAYKHVPLMQEHPTEAVLTNIVGTFNVCEAVSRSLCDRMVFISTDKAVAPAGVMGATKRVGEYIVQAHAREGTGVFCAVRFGNVVGSRGSVVPTFARQIRQGGPVTITDMNATRFFMSIPEACHLIMEAACDARGGEIFVLDMGDPVRIVDLARKMIRLHGLRPDKDIEIREVGLRPGEKLHEVLTTSSESLVSTWHPAVLRVRGDNDVALSPATVAGMVDRLRGLARSGSPHLIPTLFDVVRGPHGPLPRIQKTAVTAGADLFEAPAFGMELA